MNPSRWQQVKRVFQETLEVDPSDREQALDRRCGEDLELRHAAAGLLAAHDRASGAAFLEGATRGPQLPTELETTGASDEPVPAPTRVGPYQILRELGHGGMGTVYLAERDEPGLRMTVAVKVIRPGRDSGFVVRRFRTERQILAALQHPGIARLYDGGTTEEGLPYFVMEYVDGTDLLAWCDARSLSIPDRLRVFRRVCGAVQYAHQSLVVHRDLKPSNILVTDRGEPKLLDFGIAKLLNPGAEGEGNEETIAALRLMTPAYASPEQVQGERVTAASDIYTLGVLLYELLTGQRPYLLEGRSPAQVEDVILLREPASPSSVVAGTRTVRSSGDTHDSSTSLQQLSARRATTPPRLARRLRGDLDTIVSVALRKDPAERYASVADLSEDLRRWLDGYPVRARPVTPLARARKFVRRHRAAASAASVAVLGLVVSLALAIAQARVADAERRRAEARFQDVRRLANSVIYELHDAIANLPGATAARGLLVSRALEYLDRLAAEAGDDLELQRELADAYQRLAQVQGGSYGANLGDTEGALVSQRKALAIRERLAAREPPAPEDALGLALLEFDQGTLLRAVGRAARAEDSFLSAAARMEELRSRKEVPERELSRIGAVYQRLAATQSHMGKHAAARASAERAVAEAQAGLRVQPEDAVLKSVLTFSLHQLGEALAAQGDEAKALEQARRARALAEEQLARDPLDARQIRAMLYILNGEGRYLQTLGDLDGAIRVRRRALELAEQAQQRDPEDRWSQMGVAIAARALGRALTAGERTVEATAYFRQARRIASHASAQDPASEFARLELAAAESGLGRALMTSGSPEALVEGCQLLRSVQATWSELLEQGRLPPGEQSDLRALPDRLEACAVPGS